MESDFWLGRGDRERERQIKRSRWQVMYPEEGRRGAGEGSPRPPFRGDEWLLWALWDCPILGDSVAQIPTCERWVKTGLRAAASPASLTTGVPRQRGWGYAEAEPWASLSQEGGGSVKYISTTPEVTGGGKQDGGGQRLGTTPLRHTPCRSSGTESRPRLRRMQMLPDKELVQIHCWWGCELAQPFRRSCQLCWHYSPVLQMIPIY